MKKLFSTYFILFMITIAHLKVITRLSGIAVHQNENTKIDCHLQSGWTVSDWSFTRVKEANPLNLFNRELGISQDFKQKISFESERRNVLNLSYVQPGDAGTYRCKMPCLISGTQDICEDITELIVISRKLNCSTLYLPSVMEGNNITQQCGIEYRGNWSPVMKWTKNKEDIVDDQNVETTNIKNSHVTSTLTLVANRTMNKMTFSCTTYFVKNFIGELNRSADILPYYSEKWTSPQLSVTYEPHNLKISPSGIGDFQVGDVLTCSAEANPDAAFQWKDTANGQILNGHSFTLDQRMARYSSIQLVCTASNSIGSANLTITFVIQEKTGLQMSAALIGVIAISCVLLVLLLTLTLYVIRLKKTGVGQSGPPADVDLTQAPDETARSNANSNTPESDSYASIASELLSQGAEQARVDEVEAEEISEIQSYSKLEARELPIPAVYKQLQNSEERSQITEPSIDKGSYVNASAVKLDDYYNLAKSSSGY